MQDLTDSQLEMLANITEARICKISKDDLRLFEYQVLWDEVLEREVLDYWRGMNVVWQNYQDSGLLPPCTCSEHENGFLAKEKWNPYWYQGEPCSSAWLKLKLKERENEA